MGKLIVLFLFSPTLLLAQKNYPVLLDSYMQTQASVNEFTGTVLVAQRGKIIYEKAFGWADREWNVPNTLQTKFQIGSITKQFTAACILQLVEAGKLNLDDRLSKFFPGFNKGDSVTLHMLLNHTSGISFKEIPGLGRLSTVPLEKDTILAWLNKQVYSFSPGTNFMYSNAGYFLLGYIIEKVTGKASGDYLRTNIMQKIGLKNTFANRWDTIVSYRAKGYSKTDGKWKNAKYIAMEGVNYSAGDMISTIEDLYYWNDALFSNTILSPAMLNKMTTNYKSNYGYGLGIDTFQHHHRVGHIGVFNGFASCLNYYPADSITAIVLSNERNTNTWRILDALTAILFDHPVSNIYKHTEVVIDTKLFKRYTGLYLQNGSPFADTILVSKDRLYWHSYWYGRLELKPESDTSFFIEEEPDIQLKFKVDKKGRVIKAFFIEAGVEYEMKIK